MKRKGRRILDLLLDRYPQWNREQCLALILCGEVVVQGETVRDPAKIVFPDAKVEVHPFRYVSRGGIKLEHALKVWNIPVTGKVVLDAGASTGGFTDCLLQFGAAHVYAIDVGYNQIHPKFRKDPRVTVMEGTNILDIQVLAPPPHGSVCDLSFRSLRGVASHILSLTLENWLVALVKPQFEGGVALPGFRGVVRSEEALTRILESLQEDLQQEGIQTREILESPIRGRGGNREFFFYLVRELKDSRDNGFPMYTPSGLK
ncbi:MAG: TlyA family RNA methyltransferase [Spirochaetes bacterium]|nr:TlyA family RNA methyltransferase [Spirochaetota bacterium]